MDLEGSLQAYLSILNNQQITDIKFYFIQLKSMDIYSYDITQNIDFKADNLKNLKDHVFYNKHYLDQYISLGEKFDHNLVHMTRE